jgi:hypothetical protein
MGISSNPTYAKTWKTKRQSRLKPTGMTKLLEKWDAKWKGYDRKRFVGTSTGGMGLSDMQDTFEEFKKARTEISALEGANAKVYDRNEKDVLKDVLGDIDEEVAFWKGKMKFYEAQEGGANVVLGSLSKTAAGLDAAMADAEKRATQLEGIHAKLDKADHLKDHRESNHVVEVFGKGVDDFEAMLRVIQAKSLKLSSACQEAGKAFPGVREMGPALQKLEVARTTHDKRCKSLLGEAAAWRTWAKKQIASSPV